MWVISGAPSAASWLAPKPSLAGQLYHHLVEHVHVSSPLRLLVHPCDVRALPLHLYHPPPQTSAGQIEGHLDLGL